MSSLGGSREPSRKEQAVALLRRLGRSYVVMIVIGVVIGLQVAPVVADLSPRPNQGTVAVIPISGSIDGENAASVSARLQQARSDPSIDAVVLRLNSPGGAATASETMYLQAKRTAAEMPVITSVDSMAASGGYYAIAPSDAVYVKPSSLIGSVGVIFVAPQDIPPIDGVLTSGPDKLSGGDRREWVYRTEVIRRAFLSAVFANRNGSLRLTREELANAELYAGSEAVENGVADRIGGLSTAVRRAAQEAGLDDYRVRVLGYDRTVSFVTRSNYVAANVSRKELVSPRTVVGHPDSVGVTNVVMLPPTVVRAALEGTNASATEVSANATVAP